MFKKSIKKYFPERRLPLKTLFDKTTTMMNLQYRDIAVMTSGASELEFYQELKNHQLNQEMFHGEVRDNDKHHTNRHTF